MSEDTPLTVLPLTSDEERPDSVPNGRSKKKLGLYYTPDEATRILCSWAIQQSDERVLEPSFGACGFLEASSRRFEDLGSTEPTRTLHGCDIDDRAFTDYLEPKLGINRTDPRFLHRDFLRVQPTDFGGDLFSVVVGNPPYVSYHNMSARTRKTAEQASRQDGFNLTPKASLWAHFLLHAIGFLRVGGRMAWILPSSFLFAEYAAVVRSYIAQHFERSLVVQLRQRLFLSEGTEEITAVLLADGRRLSGEDSDHVHLDFADTLIDLEEAIRAWDRGDGRARRMNGRVSTTFLSEEAATCMQTAARAGRLLRVGDIADVRIGIVTGANPFFILDALTAQSHGLPASCLRPILAKFLAAPGASLTTADLEQARRENRRCLLVDTDHPDLEQRGSALRRYLATMPRAKRHAIRTFKKRTLWHRPDDERISDAFFPYMYQNGPRLILNESRAASTNTIHRVYFKPEAKPDGITENTWRRVCAVSILSTYSQLSGELQGRCYGAGVLKHEPSEASRIRLVIPEVLKERQVDAVFQEIDAALRDGRDEEARRSADLFVLQALLPLERERIIVTLERALDEARRRRRRANISNIKDKHAETSDGEGSAR